MTCGGARQFAFRWRCRAVQAQAMVIDMVRQSLCYLYWAALAACLGKQHVNRAVGGEKHPLYMPQGHGLLESQTILTWRLLAHRTSAHCCLLPCGLNFIKHKVWLLALFPVLLALVSRALSRWQLGSEDSGHVARVQLRSYGACLQQCSNQ